MRHSRAGVKPAMIFYHVAKPNKTSQGERVFGSWGELSVAQASSLWTFSSRRLELRYTSRCRVECVHTFCPMSRKIILTRLVRANPFIVSEGNCNISLTRDTMGCVSLAFGLGSTPIHSYQRCCRRPLGWISVVLPFLLPRAGQ